MTSTLRLGPPGEPRAIVLHGFSGSPEDWRATLEAGSIPGSALALPGHHPDLPPPESFETAVSDLLERAPRSPFDLIGYSLGGRLALGMTRAAPDRVRRLVLVACHVGLEDPGERASRLERDRRLAANLREAPARFFRAWDELPLFGASGPRIVEAARALEAYEARRALHDPDALATTLERLSLGVMPPLREVVLESARSVHLVVGALDERYKAHYEELSRHRPGLPVIVIPGAAHRILVDRPEDLGRRLSGILNDARPSPGEPSETSPRGQGSTR